MTNPIVQFRNCRLIRDHKLITEDLWVRNGRIINPESVFFDERLLAHQQVDCLGAIIAPGFIDIQINGEFIALLAGLYTHTHTVQCAGSIADALGACTCLLSCRPIHFVCATLSLT